MSEEHFYDPYGSTRKESDSDVCFVDAGDYIRVRTERDLAVTRIASLHASLDAVQADRDRLAREHAFQKDALDAMTAARDRLAAECKALSDQCQDVRAQRDKAQAELSAARAEREEVMEFLCKFINGGVNQEYRTWGRELYLRMYGADSSAGGPHS